MSEVIPPKSYQFALTILSIPLVDLQFTSSADGNRYLNTGIIITFATLVLLGAYGEKLVNLYRMLH